ncbi:MAG TPA: peptide chain release factor N(5)-glutamine methyltransferase [Candidatus Margulisiibacteriota bacterium]|nr:peptide chain release factor N(5)-glutamine methyltransferase [Candidatus Margulisiibacteriota bacterium]
MNEAELLFTKVLNCDRVSLYLDRDLSLSAQEANFISRVLKRRIQHEPLQYILGEADFMGFKVAVNPSVLIPRPETEILVETAGKYLSEVIKLKAKARVLDLGTGSGCIAIALAKYFPQADILACDISREALKVAAQNTSLQGVRVDLREGDLFDACILANDAFDLIVSNPPYIANKDFTTLQPEISYEPRIALDGGEDGLVFYRRIAAGGRRYLKDGGYLILEIGIDQALPIKEILDQEGSLKIKEVIRDYNNIERVIVVDKKG